MTPEEKRQFEKLIHTTVESSLSVVGDKLAQQSLICEQQLGKIEKEVEAISILLRGNGTRDGLTNRATLLEHRCEALERSLNDQKEIFEKELESVRKTFDNDIEKIRSNYNKIIWGIIGLFTTLVTGCVLLFLQEAMSHQH